jgi:hypothetical protein
VQCIRTFIDVLSPFKQRTAKLFIRCTPITEEVSPITIVVVLEKTTADCPATEYRFGKLISGSFPQRVGVKRQQPSEPGRIDYCNRCADYVEGVVGESMGGGSYFVFKVSCSIPTGGVPVVSYGWCF